MRCNTAHFDRNWTSTVTRAARVGGTASTHGNHDGVDRILADPQR
jgi:hypothetical protein